VASYSINSSLGSISEFAREQIRTAVEVSRFRCRFSTISLWFVRMCFSLLISQCEGKFINISYHRSLKKKMLIQSLDVLSAILVSLLWKNLSSKNMPLISLLSCPSTIYITRLKTLTNSSPVALA
jgi:hypothetical protein